MTTDLSQYQYPSRFYSLPAPMRDEYRRFHGWCVNYICIEDDTMRRRIHGHVMRYLQWLAANFNRESSKDCGSSYMQEFMVQLPQSKKSYVNKIKQSLHRYLQWQYLNGMVPGDDLTKFALVKIQVKHWEAKEVRALSANEIRYVLGNIDVVWPYDPNPVYRFSAGMKLGRTLLPKFRRSIMNAQMHAAVRMVLETGLRFEELYTLKVHQVDPDNRTIRVIGKGRKPRMVPYPPAAREAMRKWLSHRELVVNDKHDELWVSGKNLGRPLSYNGFYDRINTVFGDQIDAGWHILRKTFATVSYKTGMDLGALSKVLGHESIRTTQIYLGLDEEHVLDEAEAYHDDRAKFYDALIPKEAS